MIKNKDWHEFFKRYREERELIYKKNIELYQKDFNKFATDYSNVLIQKTKLNTTESFDFNIFKIVKSHRPEVHIHSPLIAELLNTQGKHGQKDLFYKLFIETILESTNLIKFINKNYKDYFLKQEYYTKSNKYGNGFIDILIKSKVKIKKFALLIELKWNSSDSGDNQIYKYYDYLIKYEGYNQENILIVYLTKDGEKPKKIGSKKYGELLLENNNFTVISYKNQVVKWLELCIENCKSEKVNQTIFQYKNLLKWNQ